MRTQHETIETASLPVPALRPNMASPTRRTWEFWGITTEKELADASDLMVMLGMTGWVFHDRAEAEAWLHQHASPGYRVVRIALTAEVVADSKPVTRAAM